jgi:hypothetical protein
VVFADIDPETYLLDINSVRRLLEASPKGAYAGIIPVDFAGRAVDLEAFRELADEYGLWIIEDSCHSPGGFFTKQNGEISKCGSGEFADLAIFSFHPVKHIATGEGGMITTNNRELYEKLLMLRTHGITKDQDSFQNTIDFAIGQLTGNRQPPTANRQGPIPNRQPPITNGQEPIANRQWPAWYMEMQTLGYNYRISDINCALGLSQLQRADQGLKHRHEIAARYYQAFKNIPQITDRNYEAVNSQQSTVSSRSPLTDIRPPLTAHRSPLTENGHAHHLYVIEAQNRLDLYNHLRKQNIYAQIHYIPTHLMPYYRKQGWKEGDLPEAENYYSGCISLPMYPTLTDEEHDFVIQKIVNFYN